MTLADAAQHHDAIGGAFVAFFFVLFVGGGIVLGISALARRSSRSDVHEHRGTFRHEHTGTIHHEVAGTVRHVVEHGGTVAHVHQLDPADRARLDRLVTAPFPDVALRRVPGERQPALYRHAVETGRPPKQAING